jgi:glycosyltransferase involved in cell wall biosynthesis
MGDSFIHFLFVGDGYLKGALKEQAKDLKNVSFAPSVKRTQVNHVLTESDLLVASVLNKPIYEYGISLNKFNDYMYAKKPIVCMYSGYHSIINEANCGEFTPSEDPASFADAIKKYSQMPQAMRETLGMNGYNHLVNNLSYDILVNKYIEIFR